jgi:serine/threonine protein kinase
MALEIVQIIASGTFGHVAVVRDSGSGRLLAAKVLKDEHLENSKIVHRMRDEAALLARLDHPNIVRYEGLFEVAGRPVILLEWIRGAPLDSLLVQRQQGLPPAEACQVVRLASDALYAAWHTFDPITGQPMRVIHRDIKPSNLLLSIDGQLKVVDFGIAKGNFFGKQSETVSVVLGAAGYVAPERLDGADDSPAGDVYAMGCVLFELLTARRIQLSLHPGRHVERMERHLMRLRPDGLGPRLLKDLTECVSAMVAYDPAQRPDHAEVVQALSQIMAATTWTPDLYRLATREVAPQLQERTFESPRLHPAYPGLRFLETPTGATPAGAPPRQSDERLRAFLSEDGWHLRLETLRRMLATDPSWTSAPFLEQLDRLVGGPFWKRWRQGRDTRDQLVALLEFLRARPSDEVLERARALSRHRDPEISALARELTSNPP